MIGALLIDTGFFYALHTKSDNWHKDADEKKNFLEGSKVILPWPVMYETLNTKFVGTPGAIDWFDRLVKSPDTELIDDRKYRDMCYRTVLTRKAQERGLSLVDLVLRSVIEDKNVRVTSFLTFNPRDFADVCRQHRVAML